MPPSAADQVFRPAHYASYVIEPITFINANQLSFNVGNVVKYVVRAGKKGDSAKHVEDLEKAKRYIEIELECIKRRAASAPKEAWVQTL